MHNKVMSVLGRLVLVSTLFLAAFSHTAFAGASNTPTGYDQRAYAAQFVLPDGTLPVICDWNGDGEPHHNGAVPCEFCHLAAAAFTAGNDQNFEPVTYALYAAALVNQHDSGFVYAVLVEGAPTRGPPRA